MAEGRRPFNSSMIYPSQRSQTSFVKEPWCYPLFVVLHTSFAILILQLTRIGEI